MRKQEFFQLYTSINPPAPLQFSLCISPCGPAHSDVCLQPFCCSVVGCDCAHVQHWSAPVAEVLHHQSAAPVEETYWSYYGAWNPHSVAYVITI